MTFFALGREAKSQEAETETTGRKPMVCPLCGDRYEGTYVDHANGSDRHRRAIRIIADTHEGQHEPVRVTWDEVRAVLEQGVREGVLKPEVLTLIRPLPEDKP